MRNAFVLIVLSSFAAACAGQSPLPTSLSGGSPNPSPTATARAPSDAPTPSVTPAPGFYLRAWTEQALPPLNTFGLLPMLTIRDGLAIDGNIAIPAIYPGPIFVTPFARTITDEGQRSIADEASRLGLVGDQTDFTGGGMAPGAQIARILVVIDGTTYDLSGRPDHAIGCGQVACDGEPGSPEAFTTFWQGLSMLPTWLGGELGPQQAYNAERVAVLLTPPARREPGLQQQLVTWPLAGSFDQMGVAFPGLEGARCLTITGEDVAAVVPVLERANQLTVFHDDVDGQRSASAVVLVPGVESPCDK